MSNFRLWFMGPPPCFQNERLCWLYIRVPFYEEHQLSLLRILTDRGLCGKAEAHNCQQYLAINDIDHTNSKAKSPQTNRICERCHKTILQDFCQVTFRNKIYRDIETLQTDLDQWLYKYSHQRTHQSKMCCRRTPMETLEDGEKYLARKVSSLILSWQTLPQNRKLSDQV